MAVRTLPLCNFGTTKINNNFDIVGCSVALITLAGRPRSEGSPKAAVPCGHFGELTSGYCSARARRLSPPSSARSGPRTIASR